MSLDTLLESNDSELDFAFNKLSINNSETNVETNAKKLLTEDTGKMFEMAICLLYDIPYDGEFKYNLEESKLLFLAAQSDFTAVSNPSPTPSSEPILILLKILLLLVVEGFGPITSA